VIPALELADLATAIDSLAPKYDVGVMGEMSLGASAVLALGVLNGEGANAIANRDSTVMIVSRATVRPLPQLGLGASLARDGADFDIAPNRVRLLVEFSRRASGAKQARSDAFIAQVQGQF